MIGATSGMRRFRLANLQQSSILSLYSQREYIQLDPAYQRLGDIWTLEKKQLLIDSILNGFDMPKIYFHEFNPPKSIEGSFYHYAIIDGKQRLGAIWDFIDGGFALADDFEFLHDRDTDMRGLSYNELANKYPLMKALFDAVSLPVISIQTNEIELIEEMFSRLNEAVPLNAAEKRNAFGGPMPTAIRQLARTRFFADNLPFPNSRYRHYDLAAKFLYLDFSDELVDLKKVRLDQFVKDFRAKGQEEVQSLLQNSTSVTNKMSNLFVSNDPLLRSVGTDVLYYWLFRTAINEEWSERLSRQSFLYFEDTRDENRRLAEEDLSQANYELIEYDRLAQSPNDGVALRFRFEVLYKLMSPSFAEQ